MLQATDHGKDGCVKIRYKEQEEEFTRVMEMWI